VHKDGQDVENAMKDSYCYNEQDKQVQSNRMSMEGSISHNPLAVPKSASNIIAPKLKVPMLATDPKITNMAQDWGFHLDQKKESVE
jgi:hypothetical protein